MIQISSITSVLQLCLIAHYFFLQNLVTKWFCKERGKIHVSRTVLRGRLCAVNVSCLGNEYCIRHSSRSTRNEEMGRNIAVL
jgi:hypothetical protein